MNGNNIRTSTGNLTITTAGATGGNLTLTTVGATGAGELTISSKGNATIAAGTGNISMTAGANITETALGIALNSTGTAGDAITLTSAGNINFIPNASTGAIRTDSNITTLTSVGGCKIDFAGGNADERFNIDKNDITLHWNNAAGDQADIVLENDLASLNSAINFNYQTTSGSIGTNIQNIPTIHRIVQSDTINNKGATYSPQKVELTEGSTRVAKLENTVNSGENRMDLFLNQGGGISDNAGVVNQTDNQLLYLVHTNNANSKSLQLLNPLNSVGGLSYSNTIDTNPLNIQSNFTNLQLTTLSTTIGQGDIEIAPSQSANGKLIFTGASLEDNISGPQTSQYLKITLNGNDYKIALYTP
jgi:hypothetical protein